jgi:starch synthase
MPHSAETPLLAIVGRLVDQKGFDLLAQVIPEWAERRDAQWVILGRGDATYHELLTDLAARFPDRVAARLEFSDELAHRIEAGADMFVMPSRFEPCGLNQLYSLKYGTVPIVRATGGLADTITNTNEKTLAEGTANGFSFLEYRADALAAALSRACLTFEDRTVWNQLIRTGMSQDWSWAASAKQYSELYQRVLVAT